MSNNVPEPFGIPKPSDEIEIPSLPEVTEEVTGTVTFTFSGIIDLTESYTIQNALEDLREVKTTMLLVTKNVIGSIIVPEGINNLQI